MQTLLSCVVQVLHPHYVVNIILGVIFYFLKVTPPFCYTLFNDCELEMREYELLTFLGCIVVLKNRKQASFLTYISTVCMFAKLLSFVLFVRQNAVLGAAYFLVCLAHLVFLPEPAYSGPNTITYFGNNFEDEIKHDTRVTWLVCAYAAWSPKCVTFAPIFAEMSAKYHLDNLHFGKLDMTRYPAVTKRMNIDTSTWSREIPTLVLFQGGKETRRMPLRADKKCVFTEESVTRYLELNEVYLQCQKNPIKKRKIKGETEENVDTADMEGHAKSE